ncbi:OPT oligopeptide transporter protein-domain-containing protein [Gymnopilus junonius]|uniref:OPT oligopeptide transporter protein-domain-containing protein n=1 Tax=Gymnopilus junonius TaxID=109634 RepID=A0A9P5NDP3_GYMJU|nr:OPT oligopeptide transporter protein-domain-containing protein [Gymnopilus junonius]
MLLLRFTDTALSRLMSKKGLKQVSPLQVLSNFKPGSSQHTPCINERKKIAIDEKVPVANRPPSLLDDKASDPKVDDLSLPSSEIGEVFTDGPRLIDLGDDGKERPIATDLDYSLRLLSLDDDPTLPIWTFRMWFLSLGLACFGAVLGQIFYFRPQTVASVAFTDLIGKLIYAPKISVSQLFLQIVSYILGKILEEIIPGPAKTLAFGHLIRVSGGPFNLKEHVAITIMASTASSSALAISIFAAQDLYYHIRPNAAVGIFTLIGSQLIGYGLAARHCKELLGVPYICRYPQLMPTVQLFDTLHRGHSAVMQKKRLKFFWILFIGIFVWEWFPNILHQRLMASVSSVWPTNTALGLRAYSVAAGNEGLGLFSISLDWAYVGSAISLWRVLNFLLRMLRGKYLEYAKFPFLTQLLFYKNGTEYDQLAILNPDFTLNKEKLAVQGLPWTMYIGAAVTHFLLWHYKTVLGFIRTKECDDAHYRRMKVYREISNWWYVVILFVTGAVSLGTCYAAKVWVTVVGFHYCRPLRLDMLGGALIPGKPVANMYFTMYGWNPVTQALNLLSDLKLVGFLSMDNITFTVQTIGTIVGGLLNFVIARREILLQVQGTNVWSGQQVQSYNSDAISWGALGKPLYAPGTPYAVSHLFPDVVAIVVLLESPRISEGGINFVFTPILVAELGFLSVGINSSIFSSFMLAIFSQYYLRKYRATWFRKYNFLMSAALDGGTSVMIFVYTFAVGGGSGTVRPFPTWAWFVSPFNQEMLVS